MVASRHASDTSREDAGPSMRGHQPWQGLEFDYPPEIPTMLTGEELRYLFWLTSSVWRGRGHLLEVGTWLGGSTYCLAAGMRVNERRDPMSRLHSIDNFRWRAFMSERATLELAPGMSFRAQFEANVREYLDLVTVHEARLPDDETGDIQFPQPTRGGDEALPVFRGESIGGSVALLFEDGAKSWRGLVHLLSQVGPLCEPGALIVLQDFKDWGSYWVPMAVARLREIAPRSLEVRHVLADNTVTFKLTRPLDIAVFADVEPTLSDVEVAEGLRLLDEAASLLRAHGDATGAAIVHLSGAVFLGAKEKWGDALARFRQAERTWPWSTNLGPLERARACLVRNVDSPLPPSVRARGLGVKHAVAARLHRP